MSRESDIKSYLNVTVVLKDSVEEISGEVGSKLLH